MVTYEEFVEKTGAELVAGRLIVGQLADRRVVADVSEGVLNLNDEGKKLLAELEAPPETAAEDAPKPAGRRKAADKTPELPTD